MGELVASAFLRCFERRHYRECVSQLSWAPGTPMLGDLFGWQTLLGLAFSSEYYSKDAQGIAALYDASRV